MAYEIIKIIDSDGSLEERNLTNMYALFSTTSWTIVKIAKKDLLTVFMRTMGLTADIGWSLDNYDYEMSPSELKEFSEGKGKNVAMTITFDQIKEVMKKV